MSPSFGQAAEEYVACYVAALGWEVLERNYHSRFGEIDVIAQEGTEIVFIEVKARRSNLFGTPLESVTEEKVAKIVMTAHTYLSSKGWEEKPWRVDVFTVVEKDGSLQVEHFKNFG